MRMGESMEAVNSHTLLEWLENGGDWDIQMMALEQLCMSLLMSDSVDVCFAQCPPRVFLAALCKIFIDKNAPQNVLEVAARAMTYYLDISDECARRITQYDGAVRAICERLSDAQMAERVGRELAEQCVKLLELLCRREPAAVYGAGGLGAVLEIVRKHTHSLHKDTLYSAMSVVLRLCAKVEPTDVSLPQFCAVIGSLLEQDDLKVSEYAMRCFLALSDRFACRGGNVLVIAEHGDVVDRLLSAIAPTGHIAAASVTTTASSAQFPANDQLTKVASSSSFASAELGGGGTSSGGRWPPSFASLVVSVLASFSRLSFKVTEQIVSSSLLMPAFKWLFAIKDENCVLDAVSFANLLVTLLCEGFRSPAGTASHTALTLNEDRIAFSAKRHGVNAAELRRFLVEKLRSGSTKELIFAIETGSADINGEDDAGETFLLHACEGGNIAAVKYLLDSGALVDKPGGASCATALHRAAGIGSVRIVDLLLRYGGERDARDALGRTPLQWAMDSNQRATARLLSSSSYGKQGEGNSSTSKNQASVPKAFDSEIAHRLLDQLLPLLCDLYQRFVGAKVRREVVSVIKKTLCYMSAESLASLVAEEEGEDFSAGPKLDSNTSSLATMNLTESIVNVVVVEFDRADSSDSQESALLLMKCLFTKDVKYWLDQFARVGVFEKVEAIVSKMPSCPPVERTLPTTTTTTVDVNIQVEDSEDMSDSFERLFSDVQLTQAAAEGELGRAGTTTEMTIPSDMEATSLVDLPGLAVTLSTASLSSRTPISDTVSDASEDAEVVEVDGGEQELRRFQKFVRDGIERMGGDLDALVGEWRHQSPSRAVEDAGTTVEEGRQTVVSMGRNAIGREGVEHRGETYTNRADAPTVTVDPTAAHASNAAVATEPVVQLNEQGGLPAFQSAPISLTEISEGVQYCFQQWRIVKIDDSLYFICMPVVIEFSDRSDGWFYYFSGEDFRKVLSDGTVESTFRIWDMETDALTRFLSATDTNVPTLYGIFTRPHGTITELRAGRWTLSSIRVNELNIRNANCDNGWVTVTGDITDFVVHWNNTRIRFAPNVAATAHPLRGDVPCRTAISSAVDANADALGSAQRPSRTQLLAKELWEKYLKESYAKPRDPLLSLQRASAAIMKICELYTAGELSSESEMELWSALNTVREAVTNDRLLSAFEISVSGVLGALSRVIHIADNHFHAHIPRIFKKVFGDSHSLSCLVRKLVSVLGSTEKLAVYEYDQPGSSPYDLHLLCKKIHVSLERSTTVSFSTKRLLDKKGKLITVEPLVTVKELKEAVMRVVARQWYDCAREKFHFITFIKDAVRQKREIKFTYTNDFDENGLIYWLGTNGKTASEWTNPASVGVVNITTSDSPILSHGRPTDILSRSSLPLNCHTSDQRDSQFTIDTGVLLRPTMYTLRHARGYEHSALRTWQLLGSLNGESWDVLSDHRNDASLNDPGTTASWPIAASGGPYRYLRIQQKGKNSSDRTYYLSLSGFEVYGTVLNAIVKDFKPSNKSSGDGERNRLRRRRRLETMRGERPAGRTEPPRPRADGNQTANARSIPPHLNARVAERNETGSRRSSEETESPSSSRDRVRHAAVFAPPPPNLDNRKVASWLTASRTSAASSSQTESSSSSSSPESLEATSTAQNQPVGESSLADSRGLYVGCLVGRGADWRWGDQGGGGTGTVTHVGEDGWIYVRWSEGEQNWYRYGVGGVYDIQPLPVCSLNETIHRSSVHFNSIQEPRMEMRWPSRPGGAPVAVWTSSRRETSSVATQSRHARRPWDSVRDILERSGTISPERILGRGPLADADEVPPPVVVDDSAQVTLSPTEFARTFGAPISSGGSGGESSSAAAGRDAVEGFFATYVRPLQSLLHRSRQPVDVRLVSSSADTELDVELADDEDWLEDSNEEEEENEELMYAMASKSIAEAATRIHGRVQTGGRLHESAQPDDFKDRLLLEADRILVERLTSESLMAVLNGHSHEEVNLKRSFDAIVPDFDPRPGRRHVNQHEDIDLPLSTDSSGTSGRQTARPSNIDRVGSQSGQHEEDVKLRLYVRVPIADSTVELRDDNKAFFFYVQRLMLNSQLATKPESMRRLLDGIFTLVYEEASEVGAKATDLFVTESDFFSSAFQSALSLISSLYHILEKAEELEINADVFVSEKLTAKLMQQLGNAVVVAAEGLPAWCERLVYTHPYLFSVDTRKEYLLATAFGTSRSVLWLQSHRKQVLDEGRSSRSAIAADPRPERSSQSHIGCIKYERIKVPRDDEELLSNAIKVFKFHASRKAILEVGFVGEQGTGLGPALEFYALVAAEFQRKSLALWICDDNDEEEHRLEDEQVDLGEGVKPPGYYVRRSGGLFPAALPRFSEESARACELFHVFGIFLAKVIQDSRLVDIPLSTPFLKLILSPKVTDSEVLDLRSVLTFDDYEQVSPMKGRTLKELAALVNRKRELRERGTPRGSAAASRRDSQLLTVSVGNQRCRVEDLSLTFAVNPPSSVFSYGEMELVDGGSSLEVTIDNVDEYVEKCIDFYLNTGIFDQICAFRKGFNSVFPLQSLKFFSPYELQILLSGEQCPEWTRDHIMKYTEPKHGYTRESPSFLRFVDVLMEMSPLERKSFLQFTTGCSSLPPGGLANLHPRLTIVRKVDGGDGSYPSVNTCVHYLKLPDYSTTDILRTRLLTAIREKGFHLN